MIDKKFLAQLHNSHSFFIAFDSKLKLLDVSAAFRKLTGPEVEQRGFEELFQVVKPRLPISVSLIEMFSGQLLGIVANRVPNLRFAGSFLPSADDIYVMVCFPQVTAISQLSDANLTLSDFLPHDPINFFIGTLQVKESAVVEMQRVAQKLAERKELLEAEVKKRTQELLHAEKMASIGALAAGVAHEINNPMGFIGSNLEQLRQYAGVIDTAVEHMILCAEQPDQLPVSLRESLVSAEDISELHYIREDLREMLDDSIDGCRRVNDIVKSLKTFAHPDTGKMESLKLEECIDIAIKITSNEIRHKAELTLDLADCAEIRGNSSEIAQVIVNLLINASQAIERPPGQIRVKTFMLAPNQTCLTVEDNGAGIEPDILSDLFTPFFTTKEVGSGTGLGLSVSHGIMQKHGGDIRVDSTPGKGTKFSLIFPARGSSVI